MLWTCDHCGAMNIAADLTVCPQCGTEREMSKTTADGPSNAGAAEGETGYMPPDTQDEEGPPVSPAPHETAPQTAEAAPADAAGAADELSVGKGTANAGGEAGGP